MEEKTKKLELLAEKLFELMKVKATVKVDFNEKDSFFTVNVAAGEETGLLIGKRGETLLSLQNILGVLLKQELGEWQKIVVNVGDYREKEEEYLKNIAEAAAQRAIETNSPQNLYNLKSWQRRVIHLSLSENNKVETTSEGEGEERYLIISPKK